MVIPLTAAAVSPAVAADFTRTGTTLTIAAGSTASTGTVTIATVDNAVDSPDKSVTVSRSLTGRLGVSASTRQELTTPDEEATPVVTLVLSPSTASPRAVVDAVEIWAEVVPCRVLAWRPG